MSKITGSDIMDAIGELDSKLVADCVATGKKERRTIPRWRVTAAVAAVCLFLTVATSAFVCFNIFVDPDETVESDTSDNNFCHTVLYYPMKAGCLSSMEIDDELSVELFLGNPLGFLHGDNIKLFAASYVRTGVGYLEGMTDAFMVNGEKYYELSIAEDEPGFCIYEHEEPTYGVNLSITADNLSDHPKGVIRFLFGHMHGFNEDTTILNLRYVVVDGRIGFSFVNYDEAESNAKCEPHEISDRSISLTDDGYIHSYDGVYPRDDAPEKSEDDENSYHGPNGFSYGEDHINKEYNGSKLPYCEVNGKIKWSDGSASFHAANSVAVHICDTNNIPLAITKTDSSGNYTCQVPLSYLTNTLVVKVALANDYEVLCDPQNVGYSEDIATIYNASAGYTYPDHIHHTQETVTMRLQASINQLIWLRSL